MKEFFNKSFGRIIIHIFLKITLPITLITKKQQAIRLIQTSYFYQKARQFLGKDGVGILHPAKLNQFLIFSDAERTRSAPQQRKAGPFG